MNRIVVCLDCPVYQKGGYCPHKRKEVSALQEACDHAKTMDLMFNPENKEEIMNTPPLTPQSQTKTCICCGETKPISEFYKDKKATDRHQSYCKLCFNRKSAERARKARAEKRAAKAQEPPRPTEEQAKKVVVRETLTDKQMVDLLREHGWEVTCERTITEKL